jgi:HEAT repeat protein
VKTHNVKTILRKRFVLIFFLALAVAPVFAAKVKLSNGTTFNGKLVSQNDNSITLDITGRKVSIAKSMIVSAEGLPPGVFIPPSTTSADEPAPAVQPVPVPASASVTAPVAPPAPVQATVVPPPVVPAPAQQQPTIITFPAPVQSAVVPPPVVPVQPEPASGTSPAPLQSTTSPNNGPVSQQPLPQAQANNPVVPAVPPPPAPAVVAPVQPPPPPAAIASVKRADGKSEIVLKNGTVFIGTVTAENDRFLSFSTSEGTTINILKRLIRKLDGVPYVMTAATMSPIDTSSQLKLTASAGAAVSTMAAAKKDDAKQVAPKRRILPDIAIKPGVSMAELIDSLKSTYRDQRAVSARQIGTMGQWATGSISSLVVLLGDTAGAQELPPLETDSATLQKLLPPGFEAARALARIGPQAYDELKRDARSGNQLVRSRAIFGCGEAQDAGLLPSMQQALKDDDPHVRAMAAHGLRFTEATGALVQTLGDLDGDVRAFAASTLGDLRGPLVVKALIAALKDVKPSVRAQAALSLGRANASEAILPIAGLVGDPEPLVREKAVMALGALKDTAAVPALLNAMTDAQPHVRIAAAGALTEIRDPRAIPSLYSAVEEKNDTVRAAVEAALMQLTEIPLLIAALDNENSLVRENVAYILWLMTGADLGQDKKAWINWFAEQGKEPVKKVEPVTQEKVEKKKRK